MRPVLKLQENGKGNFDIRNLGAHIAGADGTHEFDILIQSNDDALEILISKVKISDLFVRFDPAGDHYSRGVYFVTDFIRSSVTKLRLFNVRKHFMEFIKKAKELEQITSNKPIIFRCSEAEQVAVMPVRSKETA